MFRGDLLIDGYNLLHAAGLARRSYGPGEFEQTRRRLLKLLAGQLFDQERRRTTVVFDAPPQTLGPSPPTAVYGILVLFAAGDGDADATIERLIQQNSAPRRLHVVSSDHRIQKAARRRRSKFFDSEKFLARIARRPTPQERSQLAEPPEKRDGLSSPGEIDAWLQAFDVDDTASMIDDDVEQSRRPNPQRRDSGESQPTHRGPGTTQQPNSRGGDEVSFWEARIAELWEQTNADDEGSSAER